MFIWLYRDGVAEARLCPDGMVFNDYSSDQEKCDLPYNIDCTKKTLLRKFRIQESIECFSVSYRCVCIYIPGTETPIPSQHCPRQNGYFAHHDVSICDTFYYCVGGMFNMITCPAGLVFSAKTGICTWPDQAGKTGCSSRGNLFFYIPPLTKYYSTICIHFPQSSSNSTAPK